MKGDETCSNRPLAVMAFCVLDWLSIVIDLKTEFLRGYRKV